MIRIILNSGAEIVERNKIFNDSDLIISINPLTEDEELKN